MLCFQTSNYHVRNEREHKEHQQHPRNALQGADDGAVHLQNPV